MKVLQENLILRISIISFILTFIHVVINRLFTNSVQLELIAVLHLFFFVGLMFSSLYAIKIYKLNKEKLWLAYLTNIFIKFFLILGFIYFVKSYYSISKINALLHIFSWFFIYLFFEVRIILKEVKNIG